MSPASPRRVGRRRAGTRLAIGGLGLLLLGVLGPAAPAAVADPAPVAGPSVVVAGTQRLGSRTVVLGGRPIAVRGVVPAYQPGDSAAVILTRAGIPVESVEAPLVAVGGGVATFHATLMDGSGGGDLAVVLDGRTIAHVSVLASSADLGARGLTVSFLQRHLRDERYAVPLNGRFDAATGRAVVAFRKVNDLPRVTYASPEIMSMLAAGRGAYRVRRPRDGRHAEGDITHQVLALVRPGGILWRVYETSSGRPTLPTPLGRFRIYRQEYGRNSHAEVDMSFFKGICGIHGYFVVPTYPQSHCCLRVPLGDARTVRNFLHVGDLVDTFRRRRAAR